MNETVVQIECHKDDSGKETYLVGIVPPEVEQAGDQAAAPGMDEAQGEQAEEQGKSYLKPVGSVDEALQVARDLLEGDTGKQAQDAEANFRKGFAGPTAGGYG